MKYLVCRVFHFRGFGRGTHAQRTLAAFIHLAKLLSDRVLQPSHLDETASVLTSWKTLGAQSSGLLTTGPSLKHLLPVLQEIGDDFALSLGCTRVCKRCEFPVQITTVIA